MELSAFEYWRGVVALAVVAGAVAWGSVRLRRRLVPGWSGPLARTAEATMASAAVLGAAQLLSVVRQLRPGATLVAVTAVGLVMAAFGHCPVEPPSRAGPRWAPRRLVAICAAAAVFRQLASLTAMAVQGGPPHSH